MFEFKRKGKTVTLQVGTDLPYEAESMVKTVLIFEAGFSEAYMAELVCRYFENRYKEAVRSLTKKAYERGWSDHRRKKRKRQHFGCDLLQKYSDL